MWLLRVLVGALALLSVFIALAPEPPARLDSAVPLRIIEGAPGSIMLADIADRDRTVPASIVGDPQARLFRSWTANAGVRPLELEFGPLRRTPYIGVVYQGFLSGAGGANAIYLRCSADRGVKPISVGGVNTTVTETIVRLEPSWCREGQVYLRMVGGPQRNIGVVQPYERSALAYLKQSYLGYVGFFLAAFGTLLVVLLVGGLAARRLTRGLDPVLGGLLAIGGASLTVFYLYAWTPIPAPAGLAVPLAFGLAALVARTRAPELFRSVWRAQRGAVRAWFAVGLLATTVLHLAATGSGAWEPAYRFAPAAWSSDHTLPMLLAEVARIGALPQEGHLGAWSLSDRPPLLAGAYLLFADLFALLQANNDGLHLQPVALGVGGVAACSIWAAAFHWAARRCGRLSPGAATLALAVVAATPFALFNTVYTWPKLFGAAFSLAAAAYVFRRRASARTGEAVTYGALSAFAILSHASAAFFLAPVSLIYFATRLRRAPKALFAGVAMGLLLLASWSGFKLAVLPSHDPLLGYALTGELTLEPEPLAPRLAERYRGLDLFEWAQAKAEVGAYLFTPSPAPGPIGLERPPPVPDTDLAAKLRYWDFYALSAGNLALLLLGGAALAGGFRRRTPQDATAGRLMLAAIGCYALFVGVTFLPLFIHQFSYDAILAMALAGSMVLAARPSTARFLLLLAAATALYTSIVWIGFPLAETRTIDLAAAAILLLTAFALGLQAAGLRPLIEGRRSVLATAGLAAVCGLCLAWRPTAHILERAPERLALPRSASCLGAFDGLVQRRDGSWLAYGWAWDVAAGRVPGVLVVDASGASLGAARAGRPRPDVPAAIPAVTDAGAGWGLNLAGRPAAPRALAVLADGTECPLGAAAP